ncbi:MAG TPA: hypothetical protein VFM93_01340 [Candidatus Limnocylindria bacterium]|nr:hypothetical protein [Candidatus Limnocylindria bacterium]
MKKAIAAALLSIALAACGTSGTASRSVEAGNDGQQALSQMDDRFYGSGIAAPVDGSPEAGVAAIEQAEFDGWEVP